MPSGVTGVDSRESEGAPSKNQVQGSSERRADGRRLDREARLKPACREDGANPRHQLKLVADDAPAEAGSDAGKSLGTASRHRRASPGGAMIDCYRDAPSRSSFSPEPEATAVGGGSTRHSPRLRLRAHFGAHWQGVCRLEAGLQTVRSPDLSRQRCWEIARHGFTPPSGLPRRRDD